MRGLVIVLGCLVGSGCVSSVVERTPAPQTVLPAQRVHHFVGQVPRWELAFTGISYYENPCVRLVVLSELGLKLLDATVCQNVIQVHYQLPKFPNVAMGAFARMARQELARQCPPQQISYQDSRTRAVFDMTLQPGEEACP